MLRKILLVCALAVLAVAALAESAPRLSLKDLGGQTQKLSSLRGKIVVLNFWATWCEPCQDELPRLSRLAHSYDEKNVQFVAVSIDAAKDREKIEPLLYRLQVDLDVWTGADLDTLEEFGLGNVVPGTMVIDEKGQVVARVMGEARDEDVRAPLDWLLQGRAGPAPAALLKRYWLPAGRISRETPLEARNLSRRARNAPNYLLCKALAFGWLRSRDRASIE